MFHIFQQEILTISAIFVGFFPKIIEKQKKIHQDAAYLNEKMSHFDAKFNDKCNPCSKLHKLIYLYLQDSTEGDVFILYNHNFKL